MYVFTMFQLYLPWPNYNGWEDRSEAVKPSKHQQHTLTLVISWSYNIHCVCFALSYTHCWMSFIFYPSFSLSFFRIYTQWRRFAHTAKEYIEKTLCSTFSVTVIYFFFFTSFCNCASCASARCYRVYGKNILHCRASYRNTRQSSNGRSCSSYLFGKDKNAREP